MKELIKFNRYSQLHECNEEITVMDCGDYYSIRSYRSAFEQGFFNIFDDEDRYDAITSNMLVSELLQDCVENMLKERDSAVLKALRG